MIAYGVGGPVDTVIDGKTGIIFNEPSGESLAAGILRLEGIKVGLSMSCADMRRTFGIEIFHAASERGGCLRFARAWPYRRDCGNRKTRWLMSHSLIADEAPAVASNGPKPTIRRTSAQAVAKTIGSRLGWILLSGVTGMITARALGPSGRGGLAAMIMWPVFLAGVLTFGLPSALIYQVSGAGTADRAGLFTAATVLAT